MGLLGLFEEKNADRAAYEKNTERPKNCFDDFYQAYLPHPFLLFGFFPATYI